MKQPPTKPKTRTRGRKRRSILNNNRTLEQREAAALEHAQSFTAANTTPVPAKNPQPD